MSKELIETIQQRLEQLSQRKLKLEKNHQKQLLLYPQLQQPDPELESVKEEIKDLRERKLECFKILGLAASVPPHVLENEKDWSTVPFYSKRLRSLGLITPAEQLNAYSTFVVGCVGLGHALSNFYKAHHLFNSPIARKKLKNGLTIGLEPEPLLNKLNSLHTGLEDFN